jgi:adenine/guanine phosphoribosyltransferase-like PRPP-binding protein
MDGKRILLIDDTLTTGATAQSAASALSNGGATVVGILTIGRMIKPSFRETVNKYWQRQRDPRRPFTFDRCCRNSRDEPRNGDHV